ncbi:ribosomal protein S18-alanine N-acetyltransferase [Polyangium spumosum]|uniref:Ribosomal-protein-alanine N-acetyltransferase n=1 Tax=Polyangium spumosum TaxID=889282 RepID=A0A6N7PRC7_9BACT|nr:ribosomal-protein-alanine N-acetyltransferase [Polyangium spumosum]
MNDRLRVEVARVERGVEDAEELAEIARVAFAGPSFSPVDELERPWARVWVARGGEAGEAPRALGFLVAWHVVDELHVLNVATAPAVRRRGIGAVLVEAALAFAVESGVRLVLLEVRRSNEPAIRLYEKFGFSVSGVREKYYADNDEDALEMQRVLG